MVDSGKITGFILTLLIAVIVFLTDTWLLINKTRTFDGWIVTVGVIMLALGGQGMVSQRYQTYDKGLDMYTATLLATTGALIICLFGARYFFGIGLPG